ncbi:MULTISPECIES: UDP-N-acetylmuramoyl-L-alanine--D-glutamate ligase [Halobacteriovorax]|uniref:UDP-N-acetylmuramoyl-L-alanine--D-glutamate ligase n=1 Tax=Halobacteriovorax vibrionivorans TaxID=2152716 RepID=A0ABY0IKW9_9BACT|nr:MULTISPECIES: UDP-N-acetylmuramoyl-L-alanine--D-glutamate ligase [Halobacteriovorax]AYF43114.1 UDP-N-acetylmuramoyl-L-alanine--D-glutamate ligase [Halobacteriovorax sp. BALOs_7]RZF23135.1 UDP-N-acetylmuramoyl-L-alanine--D-glutamate ligase [Halobacteriovorax vibrionivorans]TGD49233.1 UDP-N-acetylmuramoyl-L-alanine--D-glutamate ligase [Halobacteriovorax sp. Y22]
MERFRNKNILIVGIGKTGFKLINFFNRLECNIRVTDIKPIFDLNKAVKKLRKIKPAVEMTFGEHLDDDFLNADVVVYSSAVDPNLPQLELARREGKQVYSEFALGNTLCRKPIIAVCGSHGRTTVAHMIGFTLRQDGKNVFVGGTSDSPFIEYSMLPNKDEIDYVVVEVSAVQMRKLDDFHPKMVVFTDIADTYPQNHFTSMGEYMETKLSIIKTLSPDDTLIVNFDKLANNSFFRNANCQTYWYSRRSFVKLGVMEEIQGTHFHDRRIHSNISYHSEFTVKKMRIIGQNNRENLLAAITACKALDLSDEAIQTCVTKFPGIPHRIEFLMEKNGVNFYNDSKATDMKTLCETTKSFKTPVILIAGGKDMEELEYEQFSDELCSTTRIIVLVGEAKERMNRALGEHPQTFIVGSFEESVLFAYQKSRTGDTIILSPGNPATDFFRDYEERGNYFKKLVYQL